MSLTNLSPGKLKILQAVATLLENPSEKVTISKIADVVGVTDAAIYRHYPSKEEIFNALYLYMESNFLSPLTAVQESDEATAERMSVVFEKFLDFFYGHPGLARLFLGHGSSGFPGAPEKLKLLHAKVRAQLAQILRFGQAKGEPAILQPEQSVELFFGLIASAALAQVYGFAQVDQAQRWQAFSQSVFGVQKQDAA
ncbi:MAG: TetR family transcriptional regulator [Alphaproteobacteria bacterium]|nr:TetR family transcriptional regulator [Alphaproteobacteria bacterium]